MTTAPRTTFVGIPMPRLPRDPFGLATGVRMLRVYNELSTLTDDELADRGMTRADIGRRVLDASRR